MLRHSLGQPSRSDFVQFQFVRIRKIYRMSKGHISLLTQEQLEEMK